MKQRTDHHVNGMLRPDENYINFISLKYKVQGVKRYIYISCVGDRYIMFFAGQWRVLYT